MSNGTALVDYSMHVYFKSGKVVASDPIELEWGTAQQKMLEAWKEFREPSYTGIVMTVNGRFTMIPKESIDYIQFHADLPEEDQKNAST